MVELFTINDAISSSISTIPYRLAILIFWGVKLGIPTYASLGFRKFYVETRSGSKLSNHTHTNCNLFSLPRNEMTSPKLL
jgi:hypothetical protein